MENLVWDAREPQPLGAFWAAALGAELITDRPDLTEARLLFAGGHFLDLCFQRVEAPSASPQRLHPDLLGGTRQAEVVERLCELGARPVDIGQGDVPWTVLADPEGNPFCVMEDRAAYRETGPIAALPLDSADPARDAAFWSAITGWVPYDGDASASLRHPSGSGPILELCLEPEPKRGKNRMHLDVRPAVGDPDLASRARELGAKPLDPAGSAGSADLSWQVFIDPSGNEFCILDAPRDGSVAREVQP